MNQGEKRRAEDAIKAIFNEKKSDAFIEAQQARDAYFAVEPPARVAAALEKIRVQIAIIDGYDWAFSYNAGKVCSLDEKSTVQPCPNSTEAVRLTALANRTNYGAKGNGREFAQMQRDIVSSLWSGKYSSMDEAVQAAYAANPQMREPIKED